MNKEAQRIAIAEACGLTVWVADGKKRGYHRGNTVYRLYPNQNPYTYMATGEKTLSGLDVLCKLPDYLNDLNAMKGAEGVLKTAGEICKYVDMLSRVCGAVDWREYASDAFVIATATAAQRAEAFLRTLGKWQEPPTPSK